tara:strand:+ start:64896 stop:66377 length:1482 start_codon:yes stop_codon:yes gene_type:complete
MRASSVHRNSDQSQPAKTSSAKWRWFAAMMIGVSVTGATWIAIPNRQVDPQPASAAQPKPKVSPVVFGDDPFEQPRSGAQAKGSVQAESAEPTNQEASPVTKSAGKKKQDKPLVKPKTVKKMVNRGIHWLVEAQQSDGGWGGGSHAKQNIRDPSAVPTDPATTAFTATALMRAGHTPTQGEHRDVVIRAMQYLVKAVEKAEPKSDKITTLTGTQPQSKLGGLIDTAMTAQFLTRVSETLPKTDPWYDRVDKALSECLARMERTQADDGSWNKGGGWAPVLQSAWNCNSLELAKAVGRDVDSDKLKLAKNYQKNNVNKATGGAKSSAAAGVELYAFSGSLRGNAADASQAQQVIASAKREGKLAADAEISEANLQAAGQSEEEAKELNDAVVQNSSQLRRLNDEQLLQGFGNNGGEEFLSYLMTSESLVIAGGKNWKTWDEKMKDRLGKVQNPDGSWSGHHCITSPVFCTAAALQVITTERDIELLKKVAAVKN